MNADTKIDTTEREKKVRDLYKALKSCMADVQELVLSKNRKGPAQELHDLMTDPEKYFGGGRKILNGTHRRFTIEDLRTYAEDIRNIAIEEGRKRRLRYCLNKYEKKPKHRIIGKFVCREHKGQAGEPITMS